MPNRTALLIRRALARTTVTIVLTLCIFTLASYFAIWNTDGTSAISRRFSRDFMGVLWVVIGLFVIAIAGVGIGRLIQRSTGVAAHFRKPLGTGERSGLIRK
jgi:hypothetical protein